MGRYYTGDIEGKFWFAIQPSDDANFFGVEGEPYCLGYFFCQADKKHIEEGIAKCKKALGTYRKKLDECFAANQMHSDDDLITAGFPKTNARGLLEWYARLQLGEKILKCVNEKGECQFDAEL